MTACIALLRGINVGRAKRIAMAELRDLVAGLGYTGVGTLLNSGNVVFRTGKPDPRGAARAIEVAIADRFGFSAAVIALTAQQLDAIVAANPLQSVATDPARHLVAFVQSGAGLAPAQPLLAQAWTPEALAVGDQAAYLWCADGILESKLAPAFARAMGETATTRNWATVLKLQALAGTTAPRS